VTSVSLRKILQDIVRLLPSAVSVWRNLILARQGSTTVPVESQNVARNVPSRDMGFPPFEMNEEIFSTS
jgi:hypothetical protein